MPNGMITSAADAEWDDYICSCCRMAGLQQHLPHGMITLATDAKWDDYSPNRYRMGCLYPQKIKIFFCYYFLDIV